MHRAKKYHLPIVQENINKATSPYNNKYQEFKRKKSIDILKEAKHPEHKANQPENHTRQLCFDISKSKKSSFNHASKFQKLMAENSVSHQENPYQNQTKNNFHQARILSFFNKKEGKSQRMDNTQTIIRNRSTQINLKNQSKQSINIHQDLSKKKSKKEFDFSPYLLKHRKIRSTTKFKPVSPSHASLTLPLQNSKHQNEMKEEKDWICERFIRNEVYGLADDFEDFN